MVSLGFARRVHSLTSKKKGTRPTRQVGRRHDSVFAVSLSVIFATLQYAVFGGGHTGDAEESSFWRNIVSPVWNHCKPFLCLDDVTVTVFLRRTVLQFAEDRFVGGRDL